MLAALLAVLANHPVPAVGDAPDGLLQVRPRKFTVGEVVVAVELVPDEPARGRRENEVVTAEDDLVRRDAPAEVEDFRRGRSVVPLCDSVVLGDGGIASGCVLSARFTDSIRRIRHERVDHAERERREDGLVRRMDDATTAARR
jgi:hypothetical protein